MRRSLLWVGVGNKSPLLERRRTGKALNAQEEESGAPPETARSPCRHVVEEPGMKAGLQ